MENKKTKKYLGKFFEKFKGHLEESFKKPNYEQILSAGVVSFVLLVTIIIFISIILFLIGNEKSILTANGIWTLITAIVSSPILFVIWRFRDQNATKQIENQRKDINLKEFQKIAEWVSGLHLIEDEITVKTVFNEEHSDGQTSEKTREYTQPNDQRIISTFSKQDGAVGLQIAAIYNLLPFFQGKHGESFRRPALNLLTSAWLALQQKALSELEIAEREEFPLTRVLGPLFESDKFNKKFNDKIKIIQKNATSPIGIALTEVLLSDGGENLRQFPTVFPNLCLAGMDFHLPGLNREVLSLFKDKDCQGINLIGVNLFIAELQGTNLKKAKLQGAELQGANLKGAKLQEANLRGANLKESNLKETELQRTSLQGAELKEIDPLAKLQEDTWDAWVELQERDLQQDKLQEAISLGAKYLGPR